MNSRFIILLVLFISCSAICGYSQTIESLKEQISKAEQEIARSKQLLNDNKSEQKSKFSSLQLLRSNIKNRKLIISSLDKQAAILRRNIANGSTNIKNLNSDLSNLKEEYAKIVINGYKDFKQSNYLLFLFSSESFHQMNVRNEYLEHLTSFSKSKSDKILSSKTQIEEYIAKQKSEQADLAETISKRASELKSLSSEEKEESNYYANLQSQEKNLNADIAKKTQLIGSLQNKISEIIAEENRKLKGESAAYTEKIIHLSGTFVNNKGKLPSPVRNGVIISSMGLQSHPTQKNVKIKSNGVNITTAKPQVTSIFDGEVVKVFFFQGLNNSVMVRHGSYISVYSNLTTVKVKVGDHVSTGQSLGLMKAVDGSMSLHLELWKETTTLNPEEWINF